MAIKIESVDIHPGDTLIIKCKGSAEWSFSIVWQVGVDVPELEGPLNCYSTRNRLTPRGIEQE